MLMAMISPFRSSLCLWHPNKTMIPFIVNLNLNYAYALGFATHAQPSQIFTNNNDEILLDLPIKENIEISRIDDGLIFPDMYSCIPLLQDCIYRKNISQGMKLHARIVKSGVESDLFLNTKLVMLYAKCGILENARQVFDKMPQRNLMAFNTLLLEYSRHGSGAETLRLFGEIRRVCTDIKADEFSFVSVVKACSNLRAIEFGKQVHAHIVKSCAVSDLSSILMSALVDFYAKCRCLQDARQLFGEMSLEDEISWTAIIAGSVKQGSCEEALDCYCKMHSAGINPSKITFRSMFKACAGVEALQEGKQIHGHMVIRGFMSHLDLVLENGLIDMYAKCGCLEDALLVYENMSKRDVVSCNTIISGFAHQGHSEEALKHFSQMQHLGVNPDAFTFASALGACANLTSIQQGRQVHASIIKSGFESDEVLGSTLVDTYAKCGSIEEAREVFDLMSHIDVVLWTVIVTAYAKHGLGKEVIQLFEEMKQLGMKPDHVTFLAVLTACSHSGLLDKGWHYFNAMTRDHGILPKAGHYACMVDILCRGGSLKEAYDFIQKMPIKPTVTVWGALLRACQVHGNTELGKLAAQRLYELDQQNCGSYVVLSNIYANVGNWGDTFQLRKTMKDVGTKKEPGCSWIEVRNMVHVFPSGGRDQEYGACLPFRR